MRRDLLRGLGWVVLAFVCITGALFTLRPEALVVAVLLALALFVPRFRRSSIAVAAVVLLMVGAALSPIGITIQNFPGPPQLTHCCPGIPSLTREAIEAQGRGECVICSDIVSGFEPRSYLVW